MEEQLTQKDLEDFKELLIETLCENSELKNSVKESVPAHPAWVQRLIDSGLVDTDGKTVIAKSLEAVAREIMKNNIQVTNVMLKRFINGKNNRPYSNQSINLAIEYANSK